MNEYTTQQRSDEWNEVGDGIICACSFDALSMFWLDNYPKLSTRLPSYDTCITCFKFTNIFFAIQRQANFQFTVPYVIDEAKIGGEDNYEAQCVDNELLETNESSDEEILYEKPTDSNLNYN